MFIPCFSLPPPPREEVWLARWDADTYLKKSFSRLKPDLLVFLGDTFSNGFETTDQQWDDYLQVQQLFAVCISLVTMLICMYSACSQCRLSNVLSVTQHCAKRFHHKGQKDFIHVHRSPIVINLHNARIHYSSVC